MSLGRFEKRRHRRPVEEDEARRKLVAVVEAREYVRADGRVCRGPIDRKRGHVPTRRWSDMAGRYVEQEHYAYCVDYARSRSARHIPLDDMIQACRVGCFTALERFDLDHPEAYRFLSYAKNWLYFETQRLIYREESLVFVDEQLRSARERLVRSCPGLDQMSDEEAAEACGLPVADVRAARQCHLGHDHRPLDQVGAERSRAVRRALGERRAESDDRRSSLLACEGLEAAVLLLPEQQQRIVCEEYGLTPLNGAANATLPQRADARRALLRLALRSLREAMEGA